MLGSLGSLLAFSSPDYDIIRLLSSTGRLVSVPRPRRDGRRAKEGEPCEGEQEEQSQEAEALQGEEEEEEEEGRLRGRQQRAVKTLNNGEWTAV